MTKAEETTTPAEVPATTHTATQPASDGGLPLVSMILGILSLVTFMLFLGIPALILGVIGLKKYPNSNKAFSITGIVTGAISTFLMLLVILLIALGFFAAFTNPEYWPDEPSQRPYDRPFYERYEHGREGA